MGASSASDIINSKIDFHSVLFSTFKTNAFWYHFILCLIVFGLFMYHYLNNRRIDYRNLPLPVGYGQLLKMSIGLCVTLVFIAFLSSMLYGYLTELVTTIQIAIQIHNGQIPDPAQLQSVPWFNLSDKDITSYRQVYEGAKALNELGSSTTTGLAWDNHVYDNVISLGLFK